MRKVNSGLFISLDGVTEAPNEWQFDVFDNELTLMIHPVVAGKGKRLFEGERALKRMKLVASTITKSGVSILTYQPA